MFGVGQESEAVVASISYDKNAGVQATDTRGLIEEGGLGHAIGCTPLSCARQRVHTLHVTAESSNRVVVPVSNGDAAIDKQAGRLRRAERRLVDGAVDAPRLRPAGHCSYFGPLGRDYTHTVVGAVDDK
jgi:hypothetical protein